MVDTYQKEEHKLSGDKIMPENTGSQQLPLITSSKIYESVANDIISKITTKHESNQVNQVCLYKDHNKEKGKQ